MERFREHLSGLANLFRTGRNWNVREDDCRKAFEDEESVGIAHWGMPGWQVFVAADVLSICGMTVLAWLFFQWIWIGAGGIFLLPLLHKVVCRSWQERMKRRFRLEFRDALQQMQSYLQAGRSMENAMLLTADTLEKAEHPGMLLPEWKRMVGQLQKNISLEYAWKDFAQKNPVAEIRQFAEVISAVRRSGGSMVQVIQTAIHEITLLIQTEEEVENIVAAQRLQMYILEAVPIGLLFFLNISAPELLAEMYRTMMGHIIMAGCLGVYLGAAVLGHWISDIKV